MEDSDLSSSVDIKGLPRALSQLRPLIKKAAGEILRAHGVESFALSISFVSDAVISGINRAALAREGPTDVIAFDLSEEGLSYEKVGDIYISVDTATENSKRFRVSLSNEVLRLVIHGVLHILGYTDYDASSRKKMRQVQEEFVKKFSGDLPC